MMIKPNVNQLLEKIDNRYKLVIATSKRARQLSNGSVRLTTKKEESPVTLAAHEIVEGRVVIINQKNEAIKN